MFQKDEEESIKAVIDTSVPQPSHVENKTDNIEDVDMSSNEQNKQPVDTGDVQSESQVSYKSQTVSGRFLFKLESLILKKMYIYYKFSRTF